MVDRLKILKQWLAGHAGDLGLRAGTLRVEELVNPSGWYDSVACLVTDGTTRLHIKLGTERDKLRRTFELRDRLQARYHAPAILAWIDLDEWCGLCMPFLPGGPGTERLLPDLIHLAGVLNADAELFAGVAGGRRHRPPGLSRPCCTTDSRPISTSWRPRGLIPPFISADTVGWMRRETGRLAASAQAAAFDVPAASPVHGDMHLGNTIVEPDGTWWLVDWDDLHRGDAAVELAILLAPLLNRGEPIDHLLGRRDAAFLERLAVCARAVLLDEIIDVLADWAHAGRAPRGAQDIRTTKRAQHERALRIYRERYG